MAYEKNVWYDNESGGTPITAEKLNHMEQGIADNADAWDSISRAEFTHTIGTISANAHGVASGKLNVPDGLKCLGIVGVWSNHNYTIMFGRTDITEDGEYSIVARATAAYSDLTVSFHVLFAHK